jgi:long-chain fatty acid transport protein
LRKLYLVAFFVFAAKAVFAGGILTNTNQSVYFLRNPARDASTEIDAVYANPAGLTFLDDGFHISLSNQFAFQTRTITATFDPFAVNNNGSNVKEFKGSTNSPIIPGLQFAYKKDKLVLSGQIAVVGGGGEVTFDDGLPSFEAPVSMLPYALTGAGISTTAYDLESSMQGNSYLIGFQVNGSYQFSDAFSGAVGLRLTSVTNGYKGYLRNIQINPQHPLLNPTGAMMKAPDFFEAAGMSDYAASTADMELDSKQTGWGFAPVLSIHYHASDLNLSAKYEFKTSVELQNDTNVDGTGMFQDGAKTPSDIPAIFSLGASYLLTEKWQVTGGYHHFFDSEAEMAGNKQEAIDGGSDEYLMGSEYRFNDRFLVSAGVQFTVTAITDDYQSDLSYSLDSYSIGFGGAWSFTPSLMLNVGYFFTDYNDWNKTSANYNGTGLAGSDVYSRTNNVFGIGLDYKF